ncbi:uncharacterized protein LOC119659077 [Hermetia illucens]|uniref:uncharacterized protein LOC119659077 n=1 Tax=Hermetia illucens TaxID=343691 RepID=UPI0018CC4561|nr:uncharacterized protein LOC119659077 [Hermetia illucens]
MATYELPHVKQNYWEMDGCRHDFHSIKCILCARPQARWRLPFRSSGFSCHLFVYLILETKQAFPSNMRNGSHNIYAKNLARWLICLPSTEFFLAIWENFLVGFPFKTLST